MGELNKMCEICGKEWATDTHHLIGGTSERKICDNYAFMKVNVCRKCHSDIHEINTANKLSKMLGQALFEMNYTHEEYVQLFKKNYL